MNNMDAVELIRYHMEKNEEAFKDTAYRIAEDFCRNGDNQIGLYIFSLLSAHNTFVPMDMQ